MCKLKPPRTGFRLRCGDYRVFFDFNDQNAIEATKFLAELQLNCSPRNIGKWQLNVGPGSTKCCAVFASRFTIQTSGSLMIINP